jgi:hypothetical protein
MRGLQKAAMFFSSQPQIFYDILHSSSLPLILPLLNTASFNTTIIIVINFIIINFIIIVTG